MMNILRDQKTQFISTFRPYSNKGLSLVEILIALTLLGLASTFIVGRVLDSLEEGNVHAARIQMAALSDRLKEFRRHCNVYPLTSQGLDALVNKPGGLDCKRYRKGGYLEDGVDIPLDPWDNEYAYESDGRTFTLLSLGKDGVEGGEEFDEDISLRRKRRKSQ